MSSDWVDRDGIPFHATTGLYDEEHGIREMDNNDVISEIKNDKPVLYCNTTHSMVNVGIEYRTDVYGNVAVDRVRVADPLPRGRFRWLSAVERLARSEGAH